MTYKNQTVINEVDLDESPTTDSSTTGGLSTKVRGVPPEVEFPNIGLGTMRTSGSIIVLLLQLEREGERAGILVRAAKDLGITLQELADEYTDTGCRNCGISMVAHKKRGGRCF